MCLIILQKANSELIPEHELRAAWQNNSDGAGYMWCDGSNLWIRKAFFKLRDLLDAYNEDRMKHAASPFVLHFRMATHGAKDTENTHPFFVNDRSIGMAHNGILWSPSKLQSDSRFFIETVLAHRTHKQIMSEEFQTWIESIVESNKLVFLDHTGEYRIVNEQLGSWEHDRWYSNSWWRISPMERRVVHHGFSYASNYAPSHVVKDGIVEPNVRDNPLGVDDDEWDEWCRWNDVVDVECEEPKQKREEAEDALPGLW